MATSQNNIRTFPAQEPIPLTITATEISRYAELQALVTELEKQKDALRSELLALHSAGAEQDATGPYLLNFVDQQRRVIDWRAQALGLAEKLYGMEKAASWKAQVEQSAPVQPVTQIRVKPNAVYAAGLKLAQGD